MYHLIESSKQVIHDKVYYAYKLIQEFESRGQADIALEEFRFALQNYPNVKYYVIEV